jgi:glutaminyl-peptide cyclotransferase
MARASPHFLVVSRPLATLVLAACIAALAGSACGSSDDPPAASRAFKANRFDQAAAWRLIQRQVDVGQRPAGTPQLRRLAVRLRRLLPHGRFEPIPGEPGLRNVVGTLPGRKPGIVIGAHYDTLVKPEGFVGANNGAAGSAIVVGVARALRRAKAPAGARQVRFVLFDGEEPAAGLPEDSRDFYHSGLRGSRAYVAAHPGESAAMVLLDYVAGKGLRLPREGSSSVALWRRVRSAAAMVGARRYFPGYSSNVIIDDHTPFLRAGVPSVDLIDWSYPGHSLRDGLDRLSKRSLDAVGETITQLALTLRADGQRP